MPSNTAWDKPGREWRPHGWVKLSMTMEGPETRYVAVIELRVLLLPRNDRASRV